MTRFLAIIYSVDELEVGVSALYFGKPGSSTA